jgi:hypothetical protein
MAGRKIGEVNDVEREIERVVATRCGGSSQERGV